MVYACSEYDCGEWVYFFVSLVIDLNDTDGAFIDAISVIEEIRKPIQLSDKIICVRRLADHLFSVDEKTERYADIEGVLELVESMKTVV